MKCIRLKSLQSLLKYSFGALLVLLLLYFIGANNLYASTVTLYPSTGSGGTTMDGRSCNGYWSTLEEAHSSYKSDSDFNSSETLPYMRSLHNGSGYYICRVGLSFDTSVIGSGQVIDSATLSFYADSADFSNDDSTSVAIVNFTPSSYGNFVKEDWSSTNLVRLSDSITFASLSYSAYTDFTLNSTGISSIDPTGQTAFYLTADNEISGSLTGNNTLRFKSADYGSLKPKLVINYSEYIPPEPEATSTPYVANATTTINCIISTLSTSSPQTVDCVMDISTFNHYLDLMPNYHEMLYLIGIFLFMFSWSFWPKVFKPVIDLFKKTP